MRVSRRDFMRGAACGVGTLALGKGLDGAKGAERVPRRPNVLFIMTDQQTLSAMSAYGNRYVKTPHMDSLAASGVRFEKSYCTSPVCSPARSGILTGRMPHVTGVEINGPTVKQGIANMGDIFRGAGYETAYTGKWHLGKESGFDFLRPDYPDGTNRALGSHTDGFWAGKAVEFLRREHKKPFLLFVSLHNPHDICYWIKRKKGLVEQADPAKCPPLPANFAVDPNEPEFITKCRRRTYYGDEARWTKDWDENDWMQYLNVYYRLTERVDKEVGRVLDALRQAGLEKNTIIVFTSDHGEGSAAHKWVVKLMLYEEPVTAPLIISYKAVIPERVADSKHLVSAIDIVPTLCDYAAIEPPEGLTGFSLRAVIEKPQAPGREFVVAELMPEPKNTEMKGRMLRTRRYKYIVFSEGRNPEMLFDLDSDPGETCNLALDPVMQKELNRHRMLLGRWIAETGDDFIIPTPARPEPETRQN